MFELTDKEFDAVVSLNADYRESFFLQKVKEHESIVIICQGDDLFLLSDESEDDDGIKSTILPVFCHTRFAQAMIDSLNTTYENLKAVTLPYKAFIENLTVPLKNEGVLLGVMPVGDGDFSVLEPDLSKVE